MYDAVMQMNKEVYDNTNNNESFKASLSNNNYLLKAKENMICGELLYKVYTKGNISLPSSRLESLFWKSDLHSLASSVLMAFKVLT